jgi:tetratricopeptide (TPR) repeat protein
VPRSGDEQLPAEVVAELTQAGGRVQAAKLAERLRAAAGAYRRDRYHDAIRISRDIVEQVPQSAAARELYGLASYRLGRWRDALNHLQAAASLGGDDPTQLPVLMDCHRALGHHRRVQELWEQLRSSSSPADVLAEGRLVLAADLADRNDLDGAIALLVGGGAGRALRHPRDRHVRQWYVLADLYERAGDLPRAREFFARVVTADPDVADAEERLAALGRQQPRGMRPRRSNRPR